MEKSEHQGYWWLPDEPENQVPGTLKFDPDEGANLNLLGSFKGAQGLGPMLDPELILGLSDRGEPITLQYCGEIKSNPTIGPGFATSSFHANTVFVGEHFQNPADVGFERLIIEYLHLDAWAGVTGFELGVPDNHKTHPITIGYTSPAPFTATVGTDCEVTLSFRATRKTSPSPITKASITQRVELAIEFPEKKPLDHLEDIAYRLQHLLSFGTRRSVYPIAMWGATGPVGKAERGAINYRSISRRGADKKRPMPHEMLFGLGDLPEGFGPTINRWLERAEVLDPVYRLYLGTIYNPQSYIEQRFSNLVRALEVYHRRAMPSSDLPEEEHKKRKEDILEAVPDQHRAWLEDKLEYSNEPSLTRRLKEIIRKYQESAYLVVGANSKDRDRFVYKVVTTRNYHTHFDRSKEAKAARGLELHQITEKLKLLIEICLLGELGLEAKRIKDLVKK